MLVLHYSKYSIEDLSDLRMGLTINDGSIIYQIKNRALNGEIFTDIGNNLIVGNTNYAFITIFRSLPFIIFFKLFMIEFIMSNKK